MFRILGLPHVEVNTDHFALPFLVTTGFRKSRRLPHLQQNLQAIHQSAFAFGCAVGIRLFQDYRAQSKKPFDARSFTNVIERRRTKKG